MSFLGMKKKEIVHRPMPLALTYIEPVLFAAENPSGSRGNAAQSIDSISNLRIR